VFFCCLPIIVPIKQLQRWLTRASVVIVQIGRTVMIFGARTALGSGANRRHAASGGHQRLEIKTFAIQTSATRRIADPMTSMRKSKVCIDHLTRVCCVNEPTMSSSIISFHQTYGIEACSLIDTGFAVFLVLQMIPIRCVWTIVCFTRLLQNIE
jgi:hypothetical protein